MKLLDSLRPGISTISLPCSQAAAPYNGVKLEGSATS